MIKKIINISGIDDKCYAVSNNGQVFMSNMINSSDSTNSSNCGLMFSIFVIIKELAKYKIIAAYAGTGHSLFQTNDGEIISMGMNTDGELLLQDYGNKIVSPIETCIKSGALFCIAGYKLSAVFFGYVPPNTPNQKLSCNDCRFAHQKIEKRIEQIYKEENMKLRSIINSKDNEIQF